MREECTLRVHSVFNLTSFGPLHGPLRSPAAGVPSGLKKKKTRVGMRTTRRVTHTTRPRRTLRHVRLTMTPPLNPLPSHNFDQKTPAPQSKCATNPAPLPTNNMCMCLQLQTLDLTGKI